MNGHLRALTRITLAAFLLLGAGACAWGQYSEGHAGVYYDEVYDVVIGFGVTWPDYSTDYYYDPRVDVGLYSDNGFDEIEFGFGGVDGYASVGVVAPAEPGVTYTVKSYHSVDVYYSYYDIDPWCSYSCYDWYDAYGYSLALTTIGEVPDLIWYPSFTLALVYLANQYMGMNEQDLIEPIPLLHVKNGVEEISGGAYAFITAGSSSSPPQMPPLTAYLTGASLTGNTTWKINVSYYDNGRSDDDTYPNSSGSTLSSTSTWNTQSDFGSNHRGGTATIQYKYNSYPWRSFVLHIGGTNPSEANAKSYLGSSPWFLKRIARQESGIQQFSSSDPKFGSPNGWGMMQLDPPPGPQEIWSWWDNADGGKALVNTKQSELDSTWTTRLNEWNTWNANHPGQQVGPPVDRTEGSQCTFKWNNGNYGSEAVKGFKDACWIKRYNGATQDYIIWDTGDPNDEHWTYNDSAGYVNAVCSQAP